ncbi:class I SAM-dependent methyltransferase [Paenibacillus cookii]|uniref:Methyltransferase domain-containing protein n=1 Tax=Paenibacillus cookii TaxID=157839 RepID=A0ABQ4LW98_9BACL|nr:class I SAM-dependent methyltransferase [Paenibacillus cookii]GIO67408.1 hypothetical protein J21TS3_22290 [Paenibacillus cookii]
MAGSVAQGGTHVVCEVPVELLFSDIDVKSSNTEHLISSFTDAWYEHHLRHSNLSIMRFEPHRELFRYFLGQSASPKPYLEWYRMIHVTRGLEPPMSPGQLLRQRKREFENMKKGLADNSSFFYDHPIEVVYHPSGYFNMKDGHHRASFLYCCGVRRVFARMSAEDHATWVNAEQAAAVKRIVKAQQRRLIYTPILNPAFYDWRSERDENYPTRLDYMLHYLGPDQLRGARVLDIGCNIGYHARCLAREGAIVTGIEHDPVHCELLKKLNDLEQTHFDWIQASFEDIEPGRFDMGVLLTVFYHVMKKEDRGSAFLAKLNASVTRLLFWESGDEPESEKRMILENTDFAYYEKLANTFGTGKHRELGVFLK